jgi:hypothetical protein
MKVHTSGPATHSVFIPKDSKLITMQVDGFGAGFPHVGIQRLADLLGHGWRDGKPTWMSVENIESPNHLTWYGSPGAVIGWRLTVGPMVEVER